MDKELLKIENLTIGFPTKSGIHTVVDHVNLEVFRTHAEMPGKPPVPPAKARQCLCMPSSHLPSSSPPMLAAASIRSAAIFSPLISIGGTFTPISTMFSKMLLISFTR